jgi:hypothetical protein
VPFWIFLKSEGLNYTWALNKLLSASLDLAFDKSSKKPFQFIYILKSIFYWLINLELESNKMENNLIIQPTSDKIEENNSKVLLHQIIISINSSMSILFCLTFLLITLYYFFTNINFFYYLMIFNLKSFSIIPAALFGIPAAISKKKIVLEIVWFPF